MTRSGQADRFDRAKLLERAFHEGKGIDEDGLPGDLDSVRVAPEVDPVVMQAPVQDAGDDGLDLSGSILRLGHDCLPASIASSPMKNTGRLEAPVACPECRVAPEPAADDLHLPERPRDVETSPT